MNNIFRIFCCSYFLFIYTAVFSCRDYTNVIAHNIGRNYFQINDEEIEIPVLNKYQENCNDSVSLHSYKRKSFPERLDTYTVSPWFKIGSVGVPLISYALIIKSSDDNFRDLRNDYIPKYKYRYDDYLQYAPAGLMLGLKAFGVEGRSSWGRMLVSDAFSAALMAATVNTLKYSVKRNRPDGSRRNSFPSGHTATAFMTATMLHKEYGMTRSYWYSAAGYTMATVTGISRQLNNKHWVSDIVFGAAVGIMATEIGYLLADLIFKDKGLLMKERKYMGYDKDKDPSFIGLHLGNTFMLKRTKSAVENGIKIKSGCNAAIEGALFKNKNFGFGGRLTAATARIFKDDVLIDDSFDVYALQVGPYFSYPISDYWLIGANVVTGIANIPDYNESYYEEGRNGAWVMGTGTSFAFMPNKNLSIKCLIDYNHIFPFSKTPAASNNSISISGGVGFVF